MSERSEKYGFVYVMCNDAMPGYYKIGATCRAPSIRAEDLSSSTSVPCSFDVIMYIEVESPFSIESLLHHEYEKFRVSASREFFKMDLAGIDALCDYMAELSVFPCFGYQHRAMKDAIESRKKKSLGVVK